ncbi:MAG TPA: hypothetical protein VF045_03525 [Acidimicrobiales bacterium]
MVTFVGVVVLFVGGWTAWCVAVARRSGPGPAALTAAPLVVFLLLVVEAGAGLSLVNFFGERPTAAEKTRAALWSGTAAAVATAAFVALAAWVRLADRNDSRSHGVLVGLAIAVAIWGGACTGMQAA